MTVKFKGTRGSDDHTEVLDIVKGILLPQQYDDIRKQFTFLINKKNVSEYQPNLMTERDANDAIKWAGRILSKVNSKVNR